MWTHHAADVIQRGIAQVSVLCEPITAEDRSQAAAEYEEQAGPAEHDDDDDDDDSSGALLWVSVSNMLLICVQLFLFQTGNRKQNK